MGGGGEGCRTGAGGAELQQGWTKYSSKAGLSLGQGVTGGCGQTGARMSQLGSGQSQARVKFSVGMNQSWDKARIGKPTWSMDLDRSLKPSMAAPCTNASSSGEAAYNTCKVCHESATRLQPAALEADCTAATASASAAFAIVVHAHLTCHKGVAAAA